MKGADDLEYDCKQSRFPRIKRSIQVCESRQSWWWVGSERTRERELVLMVLLR